MPLSNCSVHRIGYKFMWVNCNSRTTCTNMDNIELVPLELITSNRDAIRKAREAFLISKGKSLEPFGLNRRNEI